MSVKYPVVDWAKSSNIYEVNIRQYTADGTFSAFAKHLSRLKNMGVEILWLMPITPISLYKRQGTLGSYYACSSYTKINPEYGMMDDFKALMTEAHALGFKIIIDWVANHTGCDHEWTNTNPDFYILDHDGNFTERNGWIDVIDLNYNNQNMRTALIDAMKFWIEECGIDGFRCDMAHLVPLDFWDDARKICDAIKPLFWLAECEVEQYHEVFDVTYAWEWMHVTEKIAKQQSSVYQMKDVLYKYAQYPSGSKKLFFTSNHDENTWNGTEYEKYGDAAKVLAVFTFVWIGMPLIYSGQELPNYKRLKFFDKDEIKWDDKLIELNNFYKILTTLKKNKALQNGQQFIFETHFDDKILACLFTNENDKVLVLLNLSDSANINFSISHDQLQGNFKNIFTEKIYVLNQTAAIQLNRFEYAVYTVL